MVDLRHAEGAGSQYSHQVVHPEHFLDDQELGKLLQLVPLLPQKPLCSGIGLVHNATDSFIDLLLGKMAVGFLHHEFLLLVLREGHVADAVGHPEQRDLLVGQPGDAGEVVRGAGALVLEHKLFCRSASQGGAHLVHELLESLDVAVLGEVVGIAQGAVGSGLNRDLQQGVHVLHEPPHNGMTCLMVSDHPLLPLCKYSGLLLQTSNNTVNGLLEVRRGDELGLLPSGNQSGLVATVHDVSTREPCGKSGQVLCQLLLGGGRIHGQRFEVNLVNLNPVIQWGLLERDLTVKTPRSQQGLVQDVRAVGSGQNNHAGLGVEPIHLHQEGVQRALPFIIPSPLATTSAPPDGVDLVNEDDRRRYSPSLLEHVANSRGPHSDENLNKVGPRDAQKGHLGLASSRPGQQRFPDTWRANQEAPFGNLCAENLILLGVFEKVDQLLDFFLGLSQTSHILERCRNLLSSSKCEFLFVVEGVSSAWQPRGRVAEQPKEEQRRQAGNEEVPQPQTPVVSIGDRNEVVRGNTELQFELLQLPLKQRT
eukprot:RCo041000